jgi:GNAT superfamily N-acetyltransferase
MKMVPAEPKDFVRSELRSRAVTFSADSLVFRVISEDLECALASVQFEDDDLLLEEIFVASTLRRNGTGTKVLALVEDFARDHDCSRITLWAQPLDTDDDDSKEALINWYIARGYRSCGAWDDLEKVLR